MPDKMPAIYRWIPVAVALLLAIALLWGETFVWVTDLPVSGTGQDARYRIQSETE